MLSCIGYGKTIKAISSKYRCDIFDDNCKKSFVDKFGNKIFSTDNFQTEKYDKIVVTPGISPKHHLVSKNIDKIISDYDLLKDNKIPFSIWISGTNGKTTTTEMINYIINNSLSGGNIGTPILELDKNVNYWIVESSSFTLYYTKYLAPDIYVLLPISDDHLSWHGTFKDYEDSKLKPLKLMKKGSIAIVPEKYKNIDTEATIYSYKNSIDLAEKFNIDITKIKFREPFLLDAIISLAVNRLTINNINYQKLNNFKIDKYKMEELKDNLGRIWINDSKATNVDATIQALKSFSPDIKIFLIIGGDDKDADLSPLFKLFQTLNIELFCIGKNMKKLEKLSKEYNIKYSLMKIIQNAIKSIKLIHKKDSIAILSPSAASKDQFKSYKDRGEVFEKLIY